MTPRKTLLTAATAAGLLVAVTACGSDGDGLGDKSGNEIASDALEATQSLESLTMEADIDQQGQQMALSVAFNTDDECQGTVNMDSMESEFRGVGDMSYLKSSPEDWEAQGIDPEDVGDNWVAIPTAESGMDRFCSLDMFLSDFSDVEGDGSDIEVIDGETVKGVETVGLQEDDDVRIFVVDDVEEPFIAKIEHAEEGEIVFSDFNESVDIEAPAEDEVMDAEELQPGGM